MGSDNLKLMWDPANTLYCGEIVYPDGFDALRGGYISHVHIKDCGFSAESSSCILCGLAKKRKAPSPCMLYCLDPMEGLVKGVEPNAGFSVEDTLWHGKNAKL